MRIWKILSATPKRPPHVCYYKFEDGTELEYDREAHVLRADVQGRVKITATLDITAEAGSEITARAGTRITFTAPEIYFNGNLFGSSSGSAAFNAANFTVNADSVSINEGCD